MPMQTEARGGMNFGWDTGESGWNAGVDANWLRIGRVGMHLSVKDRDLATPPLAPADGDTYIVAAAATDAWAGQEGKVAVWDAVAAAWVFYTARLGWRAYLEDEDRMLTHDGAAWTARDPQLNAYTIATLPVAPKAWTIAIVTDDIGGATPAFFDGVDWRRVTDLQVVSAV